MLLLTGITRFYILAARNTSRAVDSNRIFKRRGYPTARNGVGALEENSSLLAWTLPGSYA